MVVGNLGVVVQYYRPGDQKNSTSASEIFEKCLTINFITTYPYIKQDLVFSVKLHLGLTLYPLSLPLVPYPLVLFLSQI